LQINIKNYNITIITALIITTQPINNKNSTYGSRPIAGRVLSKQR
jgi:hypothetical protein